MFELCQHVPDKNMAFILLLGKVLGRSGILPRSAQRVWDNIAEQMLLEFAESGQPIFRATTPLSRSIFKSKGKGKVSIHFAADHNTMLDNIS